MMVSPPFQSLSLARDLIELLAPISIHGSEWHDGDDISDINDKEPRRERTQRSMFWWPSSQPVLPARDQAPVMGFKEKIEDQL